MLQLGATARYAAFWPRIVRQGRPGASAPPCGVFRRSFGRCLCEAPLGLLHGAFMYCRDEKVRQPLWRQFPGGQQ